MVKYFHFDFGIYNPPPNNRIFWRKNRRQFFFWDIKHRACACPFHKWNYLSCLFQLNFWINNWKSKLFSHWILLEKKNKFFPKLINYRFDYDFLDFFIQVNPKSIKNKTKTKNPIGIFLGIISGKLNKFLLTKRHHHQWMIHRFFVTGGHCSKEKNGACNIIIV